VRLTSTVAEYQKLARIEDHASRLEAWTTGYEAAYRDVFDIYYRSYSDPRRRTEAAANVAKISPLMREREARAEALARQAEQEFIAQGLLLDELDAVFLVGNHTANGWVAEFHGRPSLFVALELLGAPPYDGILVSHEALHVAHNHHGAETWPDDVGASLIQEGIATAASRLLHPGLSDSAYLWTDEHHDQWLSECRGAERDLIAVVLDEMATPAEAPHVRGLFAPHCQAPALPTRSGYWLADVLAQHWLSEHSLKDVLRWDYEEATHRASNDLRARIKLESGGAGRHPFNAHRQIRVSRSDSWTDPHSKDTRAPAPPRPQPPSHTGKQSAEPLNRQSAGCVISSRNYDYLLGGKNHFAADRELADKVIAAIPGMRTGPRQNREFLGRTVRSLAVEAGIRQFLDIGTAADHQ
jgi:hypothetical protein